MKSNIKIILLGTLCMAVFFGVFLWQDNEATKREIAAAERQAAQAIALQESIESAEYIGNKNTHKVHTLDCAYLPMTDNRVYFSCWDDALEAGYKACEKCNPQ